MVAARLALARSGVILAGAGSSCDGEPGKTPTRINGLTDDSLNDPVPAGLRRWFVAHFAIDWLVGVPLFLAPEPILKLFGWHSVDPIATRLVAAALLGIGGQSWFGRNAGVKEFRGMLNLKIIWAAAASLGLLIGVLTGGPILAWLGLGVFLSFLALWLFWRFRL